ncbi:MAG TPA: nuclear transport factor 2 family protein [Ensifer sp.]|nr:nuclear transport factor 2 family protein [Ensifer sp.]
MQNINAAVQELLDREAIRDCLYRYCRGVDRADEAALRSAYWEDATDRHGPYQGTAAGFIEWALKSLPGFERSIHQITNVLIEFQPGGAAVESQFTAYQRAPNAAGVMQQFLLMGRYADWFEKRGEEWRVKRRTVIYDWVEEQPLPAESEAERFGVRQPIGGKKPDDAVYELFSPAPKRRAANT